MKSKELLAGCLKEYYEYDLFFQKIISCKKVYYASFGVQVLIAKSFFFFSLSVFPLFTAFDFVFLMLETTDNFLHYIYISNPRCS